MGYPGVEEKYAPAPQRRQRRTFEKLLREVSAMFADGRATRTTIGEAAELLGENQWRIVDAIDACYMLGLR